MILQTIKASRIGQAVAQNLIAIQAVLAVAMVCTSFGVFFSSGPTQKVWYWANYVPLVLLCIQTPKLRMYAFCVAGLEALNIIAQKPGLVQSLVGYHSQPPEVGLVGSILIAMALFWAAGRKGVPGQ